MAEGPLEQPDEWILVGTHRSGPPGTRRWCVSSCAQRRKDWYYGQDWYETWLSYEQPDWTLEQSSQALYQIMTEICGWHAWSLATDHAPNQQLRLRAAWRGDHHLAPREVGEAGRGVELGGRRVQGSGA